MTVQKIDMDEFGITTNKNIILTSEGVSTCIAFVVNGYYFDKSGAITNFGALFHWPGFACGEKDPQGNVQVVFTTFIESIRDSLHLKPRHPLAINLSFIGGEHKQVDNAGNNLVSGTEKEVNELSNLIRKMRFEKHALYLTAPIQHHHYKTSESDSLKITVSPTSACYEQEQSEPAPASMRFK